MPFEFVTVIATFSLSGRVNVRVVVSFTWSRLGLNVPGDNDRIFGCREFEVIEIFDDSGPSHWSPSTEHWATEMVCRPAARALPV